MQGDWNPHALLVGILNGAATVEDSSVVSQKVKYRTTIAIPILGICPKELEAKTWTDICIPMFIVALFTVAKR